MPQGAQAVLQGLDDLGEDAGVLEARRIEQTGGEPFDVTFLWERLGVQR